MKKLFKLRQRYNKIFFCNFEKCKIQFDVIIKLTKVTKNIHR